MRGRRRAWVCGVFAALTFVGVAVAVNDTLNDQVNDHVNDRGNGGGA